MKIRLAWCAELSRVVDVNRAQAAYFAQRGIRTPLTFRCPSEACRAHGAARVVAVGLEQLIADEDAFVPAHFAVPADGSHLPDCAALVAEFAAATPAAAARTRIGGATRVYDIFAPAAGADALGAQGTRSLRELVDCYLELGAVDRARARVRLHDGEPMPYTSFFRPLARCDLAAPSPVLFGGARVRFVEQGYVLSFYDRLAIGGVRCELMLPIAKDALARDEIGPLLREALMQAAGPDCHARVFFHGSIRPDPEQTRVATVRVASLDDVVVMPARVRTAGSNPPLRVPAFGERFGVHASA